MCVCVYWLLPAPPTPHALRTPDVHSPLITPCALSIMGDTVCVCLCVLAIACSSNPTLRTPDVHSPLITPCALAQQRGRVIILSVGRFVSLFVCLFVCLSAPTQDFERNRLAYVLYLLRMSQKLKIINLYLPHERERTSESQEKQTFHIFWALLKLPFKIGDLFTTTIITI